MPLATDVLSGECDHTLAVPILAHMCIGRKPQGLSGVGGCPMAALQMRVSLAAQGAISTLQVPPEHIT